MMNGVQHGLGQHGLGDFYNDYYAPGLDLVNQTARILIPGIGIVEGVYEAASTGSVHGAAKFLVPGVGIVEAALAGGTDVWQLTSTPIKNVVTSTTSLVLLTGLAAVLALIVWSD